MENNEREYYNPTQKLASDISGYTYQDQGGGARDDGYYDQENDIGKIGYLNQLVETSAEYNQAKIRDVFDFLEKERSDTNDWFYDFLKLG